MYYEVTQHLNKLLKDYIDLHDKAEWGENMGCDIHMVVQVKEAGKWNSIEEGYSERYYKVFAKLADVRNFSGSVVKPISEPRDLPEGFQIHSDNHTINPEFLLAPWRSDYGDRDYLFWMGYHSHSWLYAEEILEADWSDVIDKNFVDEVDDNLKKFFDRLRELVVKHGRESVRCVFGFDN